MPSLNKFMKKSLLKTVGKGENAGDEHFLLFLQCFLFYQRHVPPFELDLNCCLQIL